MSKPPQASGLSHRSTTVSSSCLSRAKPIGTMRRFTGGIDLMLSLINCLLMTVAEIEQRIRPNHRSICASPKSALELNQNGTAFGLGGAHRTSTELVAARQTNAPGPSLWNRGSLLTLTSSLRGKPSVGTWEVGHTHRAISSFLRAEKRIPARE